MITLQGSISKIRIFAIAALATGFFASTVSALPVAIEQYNLDGNFVNSGTGTGTLTALGSGTLGAFGYNFTPQGGLDLSGMSGLSQIYTIAIDFFVKAVDDQNFDYIKVLDFEASSLTSGSGVFIAGGTEGAIEIYTDDDVGSTFGGGTPGAIVDPDGDGIFTPLEDSNTGGSAAD